MPNNSIVPYDRNRAYKAVATAITASLARRYGSQLLSLGEKKVVKMLEDSMQSKSAPGPPLPAVSRSTAPAITAATYRGGNARTRRTSKGVIIRHRELLLGSVAGSTSFTTQNTIVLNPGILLTSASSETWLEQQAKLYEMYRWISFRVVYEPIAPTSTQGDVGIIMEYNALSPPPGTEIEAYDHMGSQIGPVWKPMTAFLDPKKLKALGPYRYVRTSNVFGDLKTYDSGQVFIVTNNETGTSTIGKVFIEYEVEFLNPVLNDASTALVAEATSFYTLTTPQSYTTAVASNVHFANQVYNPLTIVNTNGSMVLPVGTYMFTASLTAKDTGNENFTVLVQPTFAGALISGTDRTELNGSVTGSLISVATSGVFTSDGTSAFGLVATLTGAAGTLTVQTASITFQVA
jgi:hypothetical protein